MTVKRFSIALIALLLFLPLLPKTAAAAIAFDATTTGGITNGTSLTWSHTTTGSDRVLFVQVSGEQTPFDANGTTITGVTYNGVSMTLIDKRAPGSYRWVYLYYLAAPATGANNIVISASATINGMGGHAASYTGAAQTGIPDASTTNTASGASSITTSVTTVADNTWTILAAGNDYADPNASTGSTERQSNGTTVFGLYDSNGAHTPPGSKSMSVNTASGSGAWATVMASFAPPAAGGGAAERRVLIID